MSTALNRKKPKVVELDEGNFIQEVLNSDLPVAVDFWAPMCHPCVGFLPVFEELASEFEGKVHFAKLDSHTCDVYPKKYKVTSLPTIIIFNRGEIVGRLEGTFSKKYLKSYINQVLG